MPHETAARSMAPAAPIPNAVDPITVQGAAPADVMMPSGFALDITAAIPNGAIVEVDPGAERPFIRVL